MALVTMNLLEPETFKRWWMYRDLQNDRARLTEAVAAGLVVRAGWGGRRLELTEDGKALYRQAKGPLFRCRICGAWTVPANRCDHGHP